MDKVDRRRTLAAAFSTFAGLTAEGVFHNHKHTYSYGAHIAHITVDPRLGRIEILDYVGCRMSAVR